MVGLMGAFMMAAAFIESWRTPIMLYGLLEKAFLVYLVATNASFEFAQGFYVPAGMDAMITVYSIVYFASLKMGSHAKIAACHSLRPVGWHPFGHLALAKGGRLRDGRKRFGLSLDSQRPRSRTVGLPPRDDIAILLYLGGGGSASHENGVLPGGAGRRQGSEQGCRPCAPAKGRVREGPVRAHFRNGIVKRWRGRRKTRRESSTI